MNLVDPINIVTRNAPFFQPMEALRNLDTGRYDAIIVHRREIEHPSLLSEGRQR